MGACLVTMCYDCSVGVLPWQETWEKQRRESRHQNPLTLLTPINYISRLKQPIFNNPAHLGEGVLLPQLLCLGEKTGCTSPQSQVFRGLLCLSERWAECNSVFIALKPKYVFPNN